MSSLAEPTKSKQTELLPAPLKFQKIETKSAEDVNQSPHLFTWMKTKENILKDYSDKYSRPHKKPIITTPFLYPNSPPSGPIIHHEAYE